MPTNGNQLRLSGHPFDGLFNPVVGRGYFDELLPSGTFDRVRSDLAHHAFEMHGSHFGFEGDPNHAVPLAFEAIQAEEKLRLPKLWPTDTRERVLHHANTLQSGQGYLRYVEINQNIRDLIPTEFYARFLYVFSPDDRASPTERTKALGCRPIPALGVAVAASEVLGVKLDRDPVHMFNGILDRSIADAELELDWVLMRVRNRGDVQTVKALAYSLLAHPFAVPDLLFQEMKRQFDATPKRFLDNDDRFGPKTDKYLSGLMFLVLESLAEIGDEYFATSPCNSFEAGQKRVEMRQLLEDLGVITLRTEDVVQKLRTPPS